MLQSEQVPLEEWLSLAKSLFWYETNFGCESIWLKGFLSKVWISEMYLESSRKSLMKSFPKIVNDFQHLAIFANKL